MVSSMCLQDSVFKTLRKWPHQAVRHEICFLGRWEAGAVQMSDVAIFERGRMRAAQCDKKRKDQGIQQGWLKTKARWGAEGI